MNLIIFGDSIAQGCWDDEGGWPARIRQEINQKQIEKAEPFFDYNLTYLRGVSGDTSEGLKDRILNEIEAMSDTNRDITAVVAIGINDSILEEDGNRVSRGDFRENLEELIEKCREETDQLILVGLTPVDESRADPMPDEPEASFLNSEIEDYEKIIEEVAEEKSTKFIPLFDRLNEESWDEKLWDGVHPNPDGHEKIFEIVKPEIFEKLDFQLSD
ncbi:MAG: SGNH/GDSL hydrolase family protein [Candidatus Nanohalobium sp.]